MPHHRERKGLRLHGVREAVKLRPERSTASRHAGTTVWTWTTLSRGHCLIAPEERQRLFENTARSIEAASEEFKQSHIANCTEVDSAYGLCVARAMSAAPMANRLQGTE